MYNCYNNQWLHLLIAPAVKLQKCLLDLIREELLLHVTIIKELEKRIRLFLMKNNNDSFFYHFTCERRIHSLHSHAFLRMCKNALLNINGFFWISGSSLDFSNKSWCWLFRFGTIDILIFLEEKLVPTIYLQLCILIYMKVTNTRITRFFFWYLLITAR